VLCERSLKVRTCRVIIKHDSTGFERLTKVTFKIVQSLETFISRSTGSTDFLSSTKTLFNWSLEKSRRYRATRDALSTFVDERRNSHNATSSMETSHFKTSQLKASQVRGKDRWLLQRKTSLKKSFPLHWFSSSTSLLPTR
jgi:hypothetical protein